MDYSALAIPQMFPLILIALAVGVIAPVYARAKSKDPWAVFATWFGVFLLAGTTLVWSKALVDERPSLQNALLYWPLILFIVFIGTILPALVACAIFARLPRSRKDEPPQV